MRRRQFLTSALTFLTAAPLKAGGAGWNPLADPRHQPGLLWHNDWGQQYDLADVNRGSWVRRPENHRNTYAPFLLRPGRFTPALAWREGGKGAIFYPTQGILPADNFWFGMWMRFEQHLTDWRQTGIVFLGNANQKIQIAWNPDHRRIETRIRTAQGELQKTGGPIFRLPGPLPRAGDWAHLGLRIADGNIALYFNGERCPVRDERAARIVRPLFEDGVMDSTLVFDGVIPMYVAEDTGPQRGFSCSDLHIFAGAPEPGGARPTALANRLTVTPGVEPETTRLTKRMLGGCQLGNRTPDAAPLLKGTMGSIRMAALLLASPIEPTQSDRTPTPGPSPGTRWFWDTQVLYRTIDWCFACADEVLLEMGGVPTALQDPKYPRTMYFRKEQLLRDVSCSSGWVPSLPNWRGTNSRNDEGRFTVSQATADAYGEATADLYLLARQYCQRQGYDFSKIRWGFWNEPDGTQFWPGQRAFADPPQELAKMLRALVRHVRAVAPNFTIDVSGFAGTLDLERWLSTFFTDAVNNGYADALRAVHYHAYDGLAFEGLEYVLRETERLRLRAGMPRSLPVLVGEYAWTGGVRMVGKSPDWPDGLPEYSWGCTSWQAAHTVRLTLHAARLQGLFAGVEGIHFFSPVEYKPLQEDFGASGFIHLSDLTPHAPLNAMRLLRRMIVDDDIPARHGTTVWNGLPGIAHLCTVLPNGTVRILLARQAWRGNNEKTITVCLPSDYAHRPVKRFVVNDQRSSQYDAGTAHTELETIPQSPVAANGTLQFPMRGREVTLLEIGI